MEAQYHEAIFFIALCSALLRKRSSQAELYCLWRGTKSFPPEPETETQCQRHGREERGQPHSWKPGAQTRVCQGSSGGK